MFAAIAATPIGKWFAANTFRLMIVAGACLLIWFGTKAAFAALEDYNTAKFAIEQQANQIRDMQENLDKVKKSQEATLEILQGLSTEVAAIDKQAKERATSTNRKIKEIQDNAALTPEERDRETSRVYAQSLRSTYCAYVPANCPQEKKP